MYCCQCQYNLAHLVSTTCPECGRAFDSADPQTYLEEPFGAMALPLLGTRGSQLVWTWASKNKVVALVVGLVMQLGLRAFGGGFLVMLLLIASVEGESGRGRTNWGNVWFTAGLVLIGFYITHALIPLFRQAGVRDPLRWCSYPLGVLIAVLIFYSPLRP